MHPRWKKTIGVAAVAAAIAGGGAGLAFADDISNSLDGSIDAVAETMPLNVGGPNGSTTLYVQPEGGDGKSGCNLTGSTTLGVSISSNHPEIASVGPATATFTSCGDVKTLTVTPVAVGTATISVTQTSNNTGGTFDFAPATFVVNVAGPANTAPSVSVTGVSAGGSYDKGSVPEATCQVTDAEDGNSSFAATLSTISGPYASDGIGSQTADCSYTDAGGLTAAASVTYAIVDPSPPAISYVLNPASPDGNNGWYKSDVTLTWTVSDPDSPNSLTKTGCVDQNITADQAETSYSCSATSAGGSAVPESVSIKRDASAPTVTLSADRAADSGGYYNHSVDVTTSGTDNGPSGIASCDAVQTYSGPDTTGTTLYGSCSDNAGNSGQGSMTIKYDATAPSVSLTGGPADGASYYFGSVPGAPGCDASDETSGVNGSCSVSGYSSAVGTHTVTATATDNAGNQGSASATYTVLAWTPKGFYAPVDMNGVWNTVKGGSTVPLKFEVFAGSTELTSTAVVTSFKVQQVTAPGGDAVSDAVEVTTTGGTSLRYDTTAGQFIQNWQTPKKPGTYWVVTVTLQDGSTISANFGLK